MRVTRITISLAAPPLTLAGPRSKPTVYARSPLEETTAYSASLLPPVNLEATQRKLSVNTCHPLSIGPHARRAAVRSHGCRRAGAIVVGYVVDLIDLNAEPVVVEKVIERPIDQARRCWERLSR
jgi:hypothetical protein